MSEEFLASLTRAARGAGYHLDTARTLVFAIEWTREDGPLGVHVQPVRVEIDLASGTVTAVGSRAEIELAVQLWPGVRAVWGGEAATGEANGELSAEAATGVSLEFDLPAGGSVQISFQVYEALTVGPSGSTPDQGFRWGVIVANF